MHEEKVSFCLLMFVLVVFRRAAGGCCHQTDGLQEAHWQSRQARAAGHQHDEPQVLVQARQHACTTVCDEGP